MKKLALGLVIGIAIGAIGMGVYSHHASYEAKERELAGVVFINHVWDAGFATRVLEVMDNRGTTRPANCSRRSATAASMGRTD